MYTQFIFFFFFINDRGINYNISLQYKFFLFLSFFVAIFRLQYLKKILQSFKLGNWSFFRLTFAYVAWVYSILRPFQSSNKLHRIIGKPDFFRLSFRNCISCVNNCEDLLYIYFFIPQFKYMNFIYS